MRLIPSNIRLTGMLAVLAVFISCDKEMCPEIGNHDYEIEYVDGIFVEKFEDSLTDENRYNENNEIYEVCKKMKFTFFHEDKLGNRFNFKLDNGALDLSTPEERNKAWKYVSEGEATNSTVKSVIQIIKPGLEPLIQVIPDYNQTVFDYFYESGNKNELGETTGLIENENNIWMHPPRQMMFRILELNPFPFIQAPYEIGTKWDWNYLNPSGEEWSDERWLVWEGNLEIRCNYEITNFLEIDTPLGVLNCYEVTGLAHNEYGTTKLISYFNKEFGFVKLNYTNINETKTVIELVDVN